MPSLIEQVNEMTKTKNEIWQLIYKNINKAELLYHYTSIEGLFGIIDNNCFHVSNIEYLNDSREYEYGIGVFEKVIGEYLQIKTNSSDEFKQYLLNCLMKLVNTRIGEVFTLSFCSDKDKLSQWRGYSQKAQGVCIEFSEKELANINRNLSPEYFDEASNFNSIYFANRIIYNKEEQIKIAKKIVEQFIKHGEECRGRILDKSIIEYLEIHFIHHILSCLILFKDPSFEEESEWRIYIINHIKNSNNIENRSVKFKIRNNIITPYIELTTLDKSKDGISLKKLPITKVIVGPSMQQKYVIKSIENFLQYRDYCKIEVVPSQIPLR